jgi:hypothetical protein
MKNRIVLTIPATLAVIILFTYCKSKQKTTQSTTGNEAPKTATYPAPAAGPPLPPVTQGVPGEKELVEVKKMWPTATAEQLKAGHSIFYKECTGCHQPYNIVEFSVKKWMHEIDDMSPRAELTAVQKENLTKYILSYRAANAPAGK